MARIRPLLYAGAFVAAALLSSTMFVGAASATAPVNAITDPGTTLPQNVQDMVVSRSANRVFMSTSWTNDLIVADASGKLIKTIPNMGQLTNLTIDPAGKYVYEAGTSSIYRITASTLAIKSYKLPVGDCGQSVAYTGGKVWFWFTTCDGYTSGLGSLDPSSGVVRNAYSGEWMSPQFIEALPTRPDRLITYDPGTSPVEITTFDTTPATPKLLAERQEWTPSRGNCEQTAFVSRGSRVVLACGAPYVDEALNTSTLSDYKAVASGDGPSGVAVSPNGHYLAVSWGNTTDGEYVAIRNITKSIPGTVVKTFRLAPCVSQSQFPLAWGNSGRLFDVNCDLKGGTAALHVYDTGVTSS